MKMIDLSMEIYRGMPIYPDLPGPSLAVDEDWDTVARRTGSINYGAPIVTNHCVIFMSDHTGTHIDSPWHNNPEGFATERIPLEWTFSDGVVLDFTGKESGYEIMAADIEAALKKIGYALKPLDIVLIRTDASRGWETNEHYTRDQPGMSAEATHYLIDSGVRVMGIDASGWDVPIWKMHETRRYWEAHRVMLEKDYCHIENLINLHLIPRPFGFKLSVMPIKFRGISGSPIRAVAMMDG
ncbi:MAG: cyclase family protein [bacterium]|nr:cyclase family protein [bacterium]